jgi:hypothetical protein
MIVYLAGTNKKQIEILKSPISILESFAYMKKHGLIFSNKATGGIGRSQWSPGIGILKGGGKQTGI